MPRYHFDVERGGTLTPDTLGRVLDNDDAASAHAAAVLEAVERETSGSVTVYARCADKRPVVAKVALRAG